MSLIVLVLYSYCFVTRCFRYVFMGFNLAFSPDVLPKENQLRMDIQCIYLRVYQILFVYLLTKSLNFFFLLIRIVFNLQQIFIHLTIIISISRFIDIIKRIWRTIYWSSNNNCWFSPFFPLKFIYIIG